jgi:hypothetical protein
MVSEERQMQSPPHPAAEPAVNRAARTSGYTEGSEMAGLPAAELAYWAALAVTAGGDIAVFDQILSIVLNLEPWLVWVAVAGFTACALTLAHFAGRIARDRSVGYGHAGRRAVWLLVVPWLLLGLTAFAVRMIVAEQSTGTAAVGGLSARSQNTASAALFVMLYVASGAVAGVGVYLARNPYRSRYGLAERKHRKALTRLTRSQAPYERAMSVLQIHLRGRRREAENYAAARQLRLAYGDEMKRYTAILVAAHLQDPSATTGITLPDRRPLGDGSTTGREADPRTDPPTETS